MKTLGWIALLGLGALIGYGVCKSKTQTSLGSPTKTGLGATGIPRAGIPKTEAERLVTHQSLYGSQELPQRGTGLQQQGIV